MTIANPFVVVDNCKEEIEFYRSVLGGEIKILRKQDDNVLNAELNFGSTKIVFADTIAAKPSLKGDYMKVILRLETEEEFHMVNENLAAGGHINIEKYEAPFNGLLAAITDRNGIGWVLSYYRS
ncbi:VOC family protein [Paenibacillus psychroresistens]|uniref:VOC family protein n=1 Tax=Paenibacillus psychroresistens TaxID=1778678 RepID=A0A6B8RVR8_9BACL|nr:VOC family protein [Paenibacillus psychroresistens]QGQ99346.1 VOC family protein [Paenibacillus psychroresistens]